MMKTLNDYMSMSYRMEIVEDKDEGGFVVSYPDLSGCQVKKTLLAICTKPVEPWWISEKLSKKFSTWGKSANRLIIKLYTKLSTLSTRITMWMT